MVLFVPLTMNTRILLISLFLFSGASILSFSQQSFGQNFTASYPINTSKSSWEVKDPFEHKVFIENKGQFDAKKNFPENYPQQIKYVVKHEGIVIYFTPGGLSYRYDEIEAKNEKRSFIQDESEQSVGEGEEEEEYRERVNIISHSMDMNWIGSNQNVQIISGETATYYFTYANLNGPTGKSGIKALAYNKITYKNLYPHIDVEYIFPENKPGIKYTIILHPGADPSVVKMQYTGAENIFLDSDGNAVINSSFGDFTDHAPETFSSVSKTKISSSFHLQNNVVSFNVKEPETLNFKSETIVIDPWTTNPIFSVCNKAYDVDYDLKGNVYVYGGEGGGTPFEEIKFNSSSVKQWVYATTPFVTGNTGQWVVLYGDFAVDGNSSSSYLVESRYAGAKVIKLNAAGMQVGIFAGKSNFNEINRIVYNTCTKQGVVAGGGTSSHYQACVLDTNVANMTPIDVVSANKNQMDMCLLAMDNSSNCFMATVKSALYPSTNNNVLIKCPANTLLPIAYKVPDNHKFNEGFSIGYISNAGGNKAAGFNGMAVNSKYVYTYDASLLQRWNKIGRAHV